MIANQFQALGYALLGFPFVLAAVAALRLLAGRRTDRYTIVATLYGCVLVSAAFLPLPELGDARLSQTVQPVPLQWIADIGTELHKHGLSAAHAPFTSAFLQFALNVLLFLPLGALLRNRFRVGFRGAALGGFVVSALIELTQLTANFGTAAFPYRVCDVDDLLANTTGAVLGAALMTIATAITVSRRAVSPASGRPVRGAHSGDDRTVRIG